MIAITRRRALLSLSSAVGLAACGGGDAAPDPALRHQYRVLPSLPVAGHAAAVAPDGALLLIGGSRGASVLSAAITRLDPATGQWRDVGALAADRQGHVAVPLDTGQVLVLGGESSGADARLIELLDPATGRVSPAGHLALARTGPQATRLRDGRVLVTGGVLGLTQGEVAELWDPATQRPRTLASRMRHRRTDHTATLLPDGRVLLVGGYDEVEGSYVLAELFDPATERFSPLLLTAAPGADTGPRVRHAAFALADGTVMVLGGESAAPPWTAKPPLQSVLRIDAWAGSAAALPPLSQPRAEGAALALADGRVLWFGGATTAWPQPLSDTVEWYDPARGGLSQPLPGAGRNALTASRLGDGRVLLAGGWSRAGLFANSVLLYG